MFLAVAVATSVCTLPVVLLLSLLFECASCYSKLQLQSSRWIIEEHFKPRLHQAAQLTSVPYGSHCVRFHGQKL